MGIPYQQPRSAAAAASALNQKLVSCLVATPSPSMVDAAQGGRFANAGSYTVAESGISVATRHGVAFTPNGGGYGRGSTFPAMPSTPDITTCTVFIPFSSGVSGTLTNVSGGSGEVPSRVEQLSSGQIKATQGQDTTNGVITHQDSVRLQQLNVAVYTNRHTASGAAQALWLNGIKSATTTTSAAQSGFSASGQFACYNLSASRSVGLLISAVWNRILSDAEILSLSANPWQILKPSQNIALLKALAAGGTLNGAASGSDQADGVAALAAQVALAGVGVSVAGGAASPAVAIPLSATGLDVSTANASGQVTVSVSAAALAQAAGQAGLSAVVLLAAAAAAQASGNAALSAQLSAQAAGADQAGGSATLSGGAPGVLSASGGDVSAGSAVLAVTVSLQAAGADQVSGSASGQANAPGAMAAAGGDQVSGWATISTLVTLTAAGFVQAMGAGAFTVTVPIAAAGQSTAAGMAGGTVAGAVRNFRITSGVSLLTRVAASVGPQTRISHGVSHG